ncbi:MAG: glutamate--tRNA ligase [Armatimonadetes bacterium]|nr:glutamate--tRNA ligase [Armatimonadota bacterium]
MSEYRDTAFSQAMTDAATRRVRTRYAPSPTGSPHVGNLRTALFSYLLAKRFGGDFILRVEDTDQTRLVPGALNDIIQSLRTMGMMYDEGPDVLSVEKLDKEKYGDVPSELLPTFGGDHAPYFQSQRLPRYREVVDTLLAEGKAYYAFETREELDAQRAACEARKIPFLYDRKYRDYDMAEAKGRVEAGEESVVRFKMPLTGAIIAEDAVRGELSWDATSQDDFVILKGDGYPPYHLAAIVDDHDMQITHVLRGEEWIPSYPKHIELIRALGWEAPVFVHTPSILGPEKKKLSKRNGAQPVTGVIFDKQTNEPIYGYVDYEGILPEALLNALVLVGWSPGDDSEVMPRDEIVRKFDISGISASPGVFDKDKLIWMNGLYIRELPQAVLAQRSLPYLKRAKLVPESPTEEEMAYIVQVVALEQERIKTLAETPDLTEYFFLPLPNYLEKSADKWIRKGTAKAYLSNLAAFLESYSDWTHDGLEEAVRQIGAKHERERGDITHPVRVALSGRENGPGLFEMMAVLGRERVLARLTHAVQNV